MPACLQVKPFLDTIWSPAIGADRSTHAGSPPRATDGLAQQRLLPHIALLLVRLSMANARQSSPVIRRNVVGCCRRRRRCPFPAPLLCNAISWDAKSRRNNQAHNMENHRSRSLVNSGHQFVSQSHAESGSLVCCSRLNFTAGGVRHLLGATSADSLARSH